MYKDPTDVLNVDVMMGVIKDSKSMNRNEVFNKYVNEIRPSQVCYLEAYIGRICR